MSALWAVAVALAAQNTEKPEIDEKAGTVGFTARAVKQDVYAELKGVIEYAIVNKGGKAYESLFEAGVDPLALREALQKVGIEPGKPAYEDDDGKAHPPTGGKLAIRVEWKDGDKARSEPLEAFITDTTTGKAMAPVQWLFTGSKKGFVPALERPDFMVLNTNNLVALHHGDGTVLVTNPVASTSGNRYKTNKDLLPKEGTPVRIVMQAVK